MTMKLMKNNQVNEKCLFDHSLMHPVVVWCTWKLRNNKATESWLCSVDWQPVNQHPTSNIQHPTSSIQHPASNILVLIVCAASNTLQKVILTIFSLT